MKKITKEWITKAEEDYLVATREIKFKISAPSAVCFHAQQCVEKYMKAVLQENDIRFGKIHNLDKLLESCKRFIPGLAIFRNELIDLSSFAADIRYPGFSTSKKEANTCIKIMEKIRIIRKYFKLSENLAMKVVFEILLDML